MKIAVVTEPLTILASLLTRTQIYFCNWCGRSNENCSNLELVNNRYTFVKLPNNFTGDNMKIEPNLDRNTTIIKLISERIELVLTKPSFTEL